MSKETEIKKCYSMRKITKRQYDNKMRHAEHHSFAHVRKMLDHMEKGMTFSAAHKAAAASVGK